MKKEIATLIDSLREKAAGKTCLGTGNFSMDVIAQYEYPEGFVVGKRNKYEEKMPKVREGCG